jgi:hypothetical protein
MGCEKVMAFQFYCPQGHLLESDESQQGRRCVCPDCGTTFGIPLLQVRGSAELLPEPHPASGQFALRASLVGGAPPPYGSYRGAGMVSPQEPIPRIGARVFPSASHDPESVAVQKPPILVAGVSTPTSELPAADANDAAEAFDPTQNARPKIFHIACPNGHVLESPEEMLDREVLCPFCNLQFRLRYKHSDEAKHKRAFDQERLDNRRGRLWLNWAASAAGVVLVGLALMIALALR